MPEKLYEVRMQVVVQVYATSQDEAITGVKEAIAAGIDNEYTTDASFYSQNAEEVGEVA